MFYYLYFISLLVSTFLMTVMSIYTWGHREVRGAGSFAWLTMFIAGWLWCQILMQISPSVEIARFWHKVYFTNIVAVAATWFIFACTYTGQKWFTPRILVLLCVIPVISILLLWTNEAHHLFIERLDFRRVGFLLFHEQTGGLWFRYVHTPYSYAGIVVGIALLVFHAARSFRLHRVQATALIVGAVAPLILNVVATFGWIRFPASITFFGFIITGLVYGEAVFRYRLLDLAPIARDTLIERMADGMLVLDAQNQIVDLNPAMQSILCFQASNIVGQAAETVLQGRPDLLECLRDAAGAEAEIAVERSGVLCHYSLKVSPLTDRRGRQSGRLITMHDITNLRKVEEALRERTVELEISNAELDAFAHTVAHSLRSPIFALGKSAKFLEANLGRASAEETRQDVRGIIQTGDQMENIVEELLLLASVHKQEQIEIGELDIAALVTRAQERLAHEIESSQAKITAPDEWPVALGYSPWVVEVWVNYISNALKYGGRPPRVKLGATAQDGHVRFWVRDNGPGLKPGEVERLFVPFERLRQARIEGHGLGLSIVRNIVEKLDGQVGAESQVGQGSTFWFTLPSSGGAMPISSGD
jgi:PAS domain S-box-containing protein